MARLKAMLRADSLRWQILGRVQSLNLPDCWIGAGFVRNAVWDHLHSKCPAALSGDVDVVWFDPERAAPAHDMQIEATLQRLAPTVDWSVKNQARMHARNHDQPYLSTSDAIQNWPETATAIAARRIGADEIAICAPFGLDDLFNLVLRPTPRFSGEKLAMFSKRIRSKAWLARWPSLTLASPGQPVGIAPACHSLVGTRRPV